MTDPRFATKFQVDEETGCWVWTASLRNKKGYGNYTQGGKSVSAHRAAYEMHVGEIPEGMVIDHLCRNRLCVNPAHLEAVTTRENILRGAGIAAKNAVKTHCLRGHEYTPENAIRNPGGKSCRQCGRERGRAYMARRRSSQSSPEVRDTNNKEQGNNDNHA